MRITIDLTRPVSLIFADALTAELFTRKCTNLQRPGKMKRFGTMKKLGSCGVLLIAAVGCGGSNSDTTAGGKPDQAATMQNNVAQGKSGTQPIVTSGAGTEPGEVVALFLDSLRRGDENAANGVLTAQAQAELAKTEYVIQPLGTPEGKYKIGRVGFVDGDTSVGLVECVWTEPNPDQTQMPIELDIVCEVHKETQGWRISGLAVKMAGTDETLVLDFEDAASLQQALEQAGGSSKPSTPAQTASFSAPPSLGNTQMPPTGALPGQGNQPAPPQFALPGQPGQPAAGGQPAGQLGAQLPPPQFQPSQQFQPAQQPPQFNAPPTQIALPPSGPVNR